MATKPNVDLSKALADLKSTVVKRMSPEVQSAIGSLAQKTTYKPQIDPNTFYTGGYDTSIYNAEPAAVRATATLQELGKPLAEGTPGLKTPAGYDIRQLSTTGGRWAVDPLTPSKIIYDPAYDTRKEGVFSDEDKATNAILRGGLSSSHYQIDHIMPLWLGGTNEASNKRILTNPQHDHKTKVEAVIRSLLNEPLNPNNPSDTQTLIDINKARVLESMWENQDVSGVEVEDNGYLKGGRTMALKKLDEWENPKPKLMDYVKEVGQTFLKKPLALVETAIGAPVTALTAAVMNPFMPEGKKFNPITEGYKYGEKVMAGKEGLTTQPVFSGLSSGALKGYSAGYLDQTQPEFAGIAKTANDVADFVGETAGTILSYMTLSKGLSMLGKTKLIAGTAPKILPGLQTAVKGAKIGNYALGAKTIKTLESMGLFGLYGQLSSEGSMGKVLGFNEKNINQLTSKLMYDMANGALLGTASHTWKGFSRVGMGTFGISAFEGLREPGADTETVLKNAAQNAIVMTALHSMGLLSKGAQLKVEKANFRSAQEIRSELLSKGILEPKQTVIPGMEKPAEIKPQTEAEIKAETIAINKKINEQVEKNVIDQSTADKYKTANLMAEKELLKSKMTEDAKDAEALKTLDEIGEKAKDPTGIGFSDKPASLNEYLKLNEGTIKTGSALPKGDLPMGPVWLTGTSAEINPIAAENTIRYYNELAAKPQTGNPTETKGTVLLVRRPDMATQMTERNNSLTPADKALGKTPYENPQHNIQAFVKFNDGSLGEVGFAPDINTVDGKKFSQNFAIRENNKMGRNAPGFVPMAEMNIKNNKDSIGGVMETNGLQVMEVPISFINPKAVRSGQPVMIVKLTDQAWKNAIARNEGVKPLDEVNIDREVSAMKREGITASDKLKTMQLSTADGNVSGKIVTTDMITRFSNHVETAVNTGNPAALKMTIEANFGPIVDDAAIKSFMAKKGKTLGDLMNLVDKGMVEKRDLLTENGQRWQSGLSELANDTAFLKQYELMMAMPLEVNPFMAMGPSAPNVVEVAKQKKLLESSGVAEWTNPKSAAKEPTVKYEATGRKRADDTVVSAQFDRKTNTITVDAKKMEKEFPDKPWTKPKVEGVTPLPAETFKNPKEWVDFAVNHEKAHAVFPRRPNETAAAYEDRMNDAALAFAGQEDKFSKSAQNVAAAVRAKTQPQISLKLPDTIRASSVTASATTPKDVRANDIHRELVETAKARMEDYKGSSQESGELSKENMARDIKGIIDSIKISEDTGDVSMENKNRGTKGAIYTKKLGENVKVPKDIKFGSMEMADIKRKVKDELIPVAEEIINTKFDPKNEVEFKGEIYTKDDLTKAKEAYLSKPKEEWTTEDWETEIPPDTIKTYLSEKATRIYGDDSSKSMEKLYIENAKEQTREMLGVSEGDVNKEYVAPDWEAKDAAMKRQFEIFGKIFAKVGRPTNNPKGDLGSIGIRTFSENLKENIKNKSKDSYSYAWSKTWDEGLRKLFPKGYFGDYSSRFDLNQYFDLSKSKGKQYWGRMYEMINPSGLAERQPKDVVKRFNEMIGKPRAEWTAADEEYVYGKRTREAAQEAEDRLLNTEDQEKNLSISQALEKDAIAHGHVIGMDPDAFVENVTIFDQFSQGRIGSEVGQPLTAKGGYTDAYAQLINFIGEYNANAKPGKGVYLKPEMLADLQKEIFGK